MSGRRGAGAVVAFAAPGLAMLLVGIAVSDAATANASASAREVDGDLVCDVGTAHSISTLATSWLPGIVVVVSWTMALLAWNVFHASTTHLPSSRRPATRNLLAKLSTSVVVLLGAASAYLSSRPADHQLSAGALRFIVTGYAVVVLLQTTVILWGSPGTPVTAGPGPMPDDGVAHVAPDATAAQDADPGGP